MYGDRKRISVGAAFPGIDFDALLTFNGSYVTVGDEIIFKCPLDRMDKLQILQNLKDMHRALAISNEHFIITNGTDPDLEQYFRFGNEMLKSINDSMNGFMRTSIR